MSIGKNRILRPQIEDAHLGNLTQGTIFSCAKAFRYPGKEVHGLAITARCDVAQEKYRLLNYLPIVRLSDWFLLDGLEILIDRELKDKKGKIINCLKENNLSPNLILSVSISEIVKVHFSSSKQAGGNSKARDRLISIDSDIKLINRLLDSKEELFSWFVNNRCKLIKSLLRELFDHKVVGYYFMERILPTSIADGFVCLLREVASLPREVAVELASGLSRERWREFGPESGGGGLDLSLDDLAMPVSQLGSPSIEHLMQSYANLFGRIGIADPQAAEMDEILSRTLSFRISEDEA
ncbi:hypothetical protein [Stappia indica]|uniref:hypothetical protein n=1 Tax=Stappia indica TaxID=538381 RepID=UPI001CD3A351|nr:hypothetical protein [Stappia indica]MCA1297721.1 hypothetical protein [Stappia indica]